MLCPYASALYNINNGNYLSAVADAGFFITDFSVVKGIAKLGYRAFLYSWKQAAKPGVFWAVWGFPQKVFFNQAPNHFMWQVGDYVYDAVRQSDGVMKVGRELAENSGSYQTWKWRLPIPLPAIFKDAANTCGATGGNCLTQLVTAMEAAGVPEAMQTIIKGVYLYDNDE